MRRSVSVQSGRVIMGRSMLRASIESRVTINLDVDVEKREITANYACRIHACEWTHTATFLLCNTERARVRALAALIAHLRDAHNVSMGDSEL